MKSVKRIDAPVGRTEPSKRVAAYCRVSKDSERLKNSLANQVSYFSALIQKNPDWEYAGVYADEGISGMRTSGRDGFNRLLGDCERGLIDIVLAKSISRFARNTVDLLKSVRRLKELGIDVWFEKEGVRTLSAEGEVLLTLLATFAQLESESISENVKWGIRKRMRDGVPHGRPRVFGYRWGEDGLDVCDEEAATVGRIFDEFLGGKGVCAIASGLNADGVPSRDGREWSKTQVGYILSNRAYAGDLHLQKFFIADPLSGTKRRNAGELPQYIVEDDHEPIVERATFERAQEELARRRALGWRGNKSLNLSCFSGRVKCALCGRSFVHGSARVTRGKGTPHPEKSGYWCCASAKEGGGGCRSCHISDAAMRAASAEALGLDAFDEEAFESGIASVTAYPDGRLAFELSDGTTREVGRAPDGRSAPWSEERRRAQSERNRRQCASGKGRYRPFTTRIRCAGCGADFRHRVNVTKGRGRVGRWTHSGEVAEGCALFGLDDERLEAVCADVLGTASFDGDAFMEEVERVDVTEDMELLFRLRDGTLRRYAYGRHGRGRAVACSSHDAEGGDGDGSR